MSEHIETLRRLALEGKTRAEAAKMVGIHFETVKKMARVHNIPFRHGNEKEVLRRPRAIGPIQAMKTSGALHELSAKERLDTLTLIRKGLQSAPEALKGIGRADLVERYFRCQ